jgi:hypothetical protein
MAPEATPPPEVSKKGRKNLEDMTLDEKGNV